MAQIKKSTVVSVGIVSATLFFGAGSALAAGAGDATEGEVVFSENCEICHSAEQGGAHKIGPNLFGIVGKMSATAEGYPYSEGMASADLSWTPENLAMFLAGPAQMVPGTKMGFPGFTNPEDEAHLLAYLATLQ